jgi:hypothetical protein
MSSPVQRPHHHRAPCVDLDGKRMTSSVHAWSSTGDDEAGGTLINELDELIKADEAEQRVVGHSAGAMSGRRAVDILRKKKRRRRPRQAVLAGRGENTSETRSFQPPIISYTMSGLGITIAPASEPNVLGVEGVFAEIMATVQNLGQWTSRSEHEARAHPALWHAEIADLQQERAAAYAKHEPRAPGATIWYPNQGVSFVGARAALTTLLRTCRVMR